MEELTREKERKVGDALGNLIVSMVPEIHRNTWPPYELMRGDPVLLFADSHNTRRKVLGWLLSCTNFYSMISPSSTVCLPTSITSTSCNTSFPPSEYPLVVSISFATLRVPLLKCLSGMDLRLGFGVTGALPSRLWWVITWQIFISTVFYQAPGSSPYVCAKIEYLRGWK